MEFPEPTLYTDGVRTYEVWPTDAFPPELVRFLNAASKIGEGQYLVARHKGRLMAVIDNPEDFGLIPESASRFRLRGVGPVAATPTFPRGSVAPTVRQVAGHVLEVKAAFKAGAITLTKITLAGQKLVVPVTLPAGVVGEPAAETVPGPREDFTPPAGTVTITTGQNAANVINNAAAGTKFLFEAGVHAITSTITTKSGMELYGEYGAILDGGEESRYIRLGGSGGRLENLVIRNFHVPLQDAAVMGASGSGTNMVIAHCEFTGNTIALYTKSGWQVLNCDIHHQLQLGVSGAGNNVLMDGCEIHHNNTEGHDSQWEAGATKFVHATDLLIRNCYSHDNDGPGFWTDGTVYDPVVEDCVAESDAGPGINIEITYGGLVQRNTVVDCGHGWTSWTDGSGILVTASPGVEVAYNQVLECRLGIGGQDRNRGSGQSGPYLLQDLWVHNNETDGVTGIVSQDDRSEPYGAWNNKFDHNHYRFAKSAARFNWQNGPLRTGTQWQGYGNDLNGTWES